MAKVEQSVKDAITSLSKNELEKLVLKAAQKSKEFHDTFIEDLEKILVDAVDCYSYFQAGDNPMENLSFPLHRLHRIQSMEFLYPPATEKKILSKPNAINIVEEKPKQKRLK